MVGTCFILVWTEEKKPATAGALRVVIQCLTDLI
jgi:hypothetical protein